MKKITKALAFFLATVFIISTFSILASAATWKTGRIPANYKNDGYVTVRLQNTNKKATIKIHAYWTLSGSGTGREGNSRLNVTMRDTSGRWIWSGDIDTGKSGKTMTLGKDHSAYRIYIREVKLPGIKYYENYYHPTYWGIECRSNCYM